MDFESVASVSFEVIAELFSLSFSNYFGRGEIHVTAEEAKLWCESNFVSLERSSVFYNSSEPKRPVAFTLIATREDKPGEVRLAAMGLIPTYQGKGTGSKVMSIVIEEEKKRSAHLIELECIRQNERGLRLYQRHGFTITQELVGWEKDPDPEAEQNTTVSPQLVEGTVNELDALVKLHGAADLPWQAWGFSTSRHTERIFKLGHDFCAISDPYSDEKDTITLSCLFVEPDHRQQGQAKALAEAMMMKFPTKKWSITPIFPEEPGNKLAAALGMKRMEIGEFPMRLSLV